MKFARKSPSASTARGNLIDRHTDAQGQCCPIRVGLSKISYYLIYRSSQAVAEVR